MQPSPAIIDLVGLLPEDLTLLTAKLDAKPFRARQLWHWMYHHGATDFSKMRNLPHTFRKKLDTCCVVSRPQVSQSIASSDSTHKWLLRFSDGREVETVYIPTKDDRNGGTLCVSSQVGCSLTCRFCHTGTQRLVRNLSAAEIVSQLLVAREIYPSSRDKHPLANVVMMGMGEPLLNYDNLITALKILMNPEGLSVSHRRMTVSTAGIVPAIYSLRKENFCNLAISLHAATDTVRDSLMPINRRYPLAELMAACRAYQKDGPARRRITFEYIMLKGINDSAADARAVAQLVKGVQCNFNLIPFNKWSGAPYICSTAPAIHRFSTILKDSGYAAPIRAVRGRDICAACGQLRSSSAM